ncbi:tetratricopeptide repeat protein [Calothrix sp. FACHB-1219]|uniref:CHAT domain-containing tetratricopeptide repeat protein n=1 Tax=Calothrix sp. FACHB-1219 TaxID=2692778 RepID=UPI00168439A4|nr:tetratricopeptide repeat protein [Calothrix sp. FACHB-1219]MBD2222359.1 tetratricopeptide repeat protein [Calothrix sp. FACHB-1219]
MLKLYTLTCLLSVVLLSESVGAKATFKQTQIAQQPTTTQDATRAAAQKAFEEGMALYKQGTAESLRQAREKWQEALILWRKAGDKEWQAITLLSIGRVYSDLGEKQKALEYYNNALSLWRAVGDRSGEATTLNNIGLVYDDLGEKPKALEYYNKALPLRRAVGDRFGEATTLNNIGAVYNDLGEKQKALEYYNNALPLRRAVGDRSGEATTLNNIGLVYDDLGEKPKALEYYNKALPLRRAVGDRSGEATTLVSFGNVYSDLGEKQKALEYFNKALPLWRAVGDRSGEAITLVSFGNVYSDLGEKQKALEYYNNALSLYQAVGDRSGEATTLNNIGLVYDDLGEKQKALEYYNNALPRRRAVGDRSGEAYTLVNIGYIYFALGEKQKALEYFNNALPILRAVGDRSGEATTLGNIASLERDRGNLQAARTNVEAAIAIIEQLRTKIDNKDLRSSYFATQQGVYKFYIDLLMELHKKEPSQGYAALALHYSERSRARSLIELLNEANAKILKGANPQLIAQERNLRQQIDAKTTLRRNLENSTNKNDLVTKAAIQRLSQEIANLSNQYEQLQATIRASNPEYAKLTNPDPDKDILKLPQIQQQLDQDTLLLQYSLGEERSFLWAVTSTSMQVYTLPPRQEIEKVATRFHSSLQQETAGEFAIEEAQNLSKLILAPVANQLPGKRLVIVADGGLQTIPFAALADVNERGTGGTRGTGEKSLLKASHSAQQSMKICLSHALCPMPYAHVQAGSEYQPLMVNHEIVNLPSASTIAFQRQQLAKRQPAPKALAILADPVFNTTDCRFKDENCQEADQPQSRNKNLDVSAELQQSQLNRSAKNLKRNGWNRLPFTAEEAKAILKLIPAANSLKALSFDANYNWATSGALNQYRILHFATHGIVDPKEPHLSGILLSSYDKQGKYLTENKLSLGDLFNQDYPAELIVLSACDTGLGKDVNGEGLVGLTRGLMYAGAARVAVSLWQVNDEGTSILMQEFYQQMLQQNKKPAEALRAAQMKLWQDGRSLNEWAAFTVQGEWR